MTAFLAGATTAHLQYYSSSGTGYNYWTDQVSLKSVENWNLLAGSAVNDLLIVHGTGTKYDGAGGADTLYADWSGVAPTTTQSRSRTARPSSSSRTAPPTR